MMQMPDFHNYAVHGVIKDNLKLERAVFLFNNITHWVQCMVLDHVKPQERAGAFVKFVEIAKVQNSLLAYFSFFLGLKLVYVCKRNDPARPSACVVSSTFHTWRF